jgi:hypothetical protein
MMAAKRDWLIAGSETVQSDGAALLSTPKDHCQFIT